MTRVKRSVTSHAKHKKELKLAKGYRGTRSKHLKKARESNLHAGKYARRDRRARKGDLRRIWVVRLNAAVRLYGISYSEFIAMMDKANVSVNRKILSEIAAQNPAAFAQIVEDVKKTAA